MPPGGIFSAVLAISSYEVPRKPQDCIMSAFFSSLIYYALRSVFSALLLLLLCNDDAAAHASFSGVAFAPALQAARSLEVQWFTGKNSSRRVIVRDTIYAEEELISPQFHLGT